MLKMTNGTIATGIAHTWDESKKSSAKLYLHVYEEGGNGEGSECIMGEVVGHQLDLPLAVGRLPVRDDVVDGDVPEQVEQAADQPKHQDPD